MAISLQREDRIFLTLVTLLLPTTFIHREILFANMSNLWLQYVDRETCKGIGEDKRFTATAQNPKSLTQDP